MPFHTPFLQDILLSGGLITRRHRYEDLIDTAFAEAALREHPVPDAPRS